MQFDVFRNVRPSKVFPLVVDLQADLHARIDTRVMAPLTPRRLWTQSITRLHPVVTVTGGDYVLVVSMLAATPTHGYATPVASIAARRSDILAALDLLLTGI